MFVGVLGMWWLRFVAAKRGRRGLLFLLVEQFLLVLVNCGCPHFPTSTPYHLHTACFLPPPSFTARIAAYAAWLDRMPAGQGITSLLPTPTITISLVVPFS